MRSLSKSSESGRDKGTGYKKSCKDWLAHKARLGRCPQAKMWPLLVQATAWDVPEAIPAILGVEGGNWSWTRYEKTRSKGGSRGEGTFEGEIHPKTPLILRPQA